MPIWRKAPPFAHVAGALLVAAASTCSLVSNFSGLTSDGLGGGNTGGASTNASTGASGGATTIAASSGITGASSVASTGSASVTTGAGGMTSASSTAQSSSSASSGTGGSGGSFANCAPGSTDSLIDNFNGASLDPNWLVTLVGQGQTIKQQNGELVFALSPEGSQQIAEIATGKTYSFTNCSFQVQVTKVPTATGFGGILALSGATEDRLEMTYDSGNIKLRYWIGVNSTAVGQVVYDASKHAWWRLREAGGMTYFETAPDGKAFTSIGSVATPIPVTAVHVGFFGGVEPTNQAVGEMHFDNLNTAP